jgi:hypothetical protein
MLSELYQFRDNRAPETIVGRGAKAMVASAWRLRTTDYKQSDGAMLTWNIHRGRHLSYQRGKRNTNPGTSLIQIEGVENTEAAKYVGKLGCMKGKY